MSTPIEKPRFPYLISQPDSQLSGVAMTPEQTEIARYIQGLTKSFKNTLIDTQIRRHQTHWGKEGNLLAQRLTRFGVDPYQISDFIKLIFSGTAVHPAPLAVSRNYDRYSASEIEKALQTQIEQRAKGIPPATEAIKSYEAPETLFSSDEVTDFTRTATLQVQSAIRQGKFKGFEVPALNDSSSVFEFPGPQQRLVLITRKYPDAIKTSIVVYSRDHLTAEKISLVDPTETDTQPEIKYTNNNPDQTSESSNNLATATKAWDHLTSILALRQGKTRN